MEHLWTVCLLLLSIWDQVFPITFDSDIELLNFILNWKIFTFILSRLIFFKVYYKLNYSMQLSFCFWYQVVFGYHRLSFEVWKFILSKEKTLFRLIICKVIEVELFFFGSLLLYFYHPACVLFDLFLTFSPTHLSSEWLSIASSYFSTTIGPAPIWFLLQNHQDIFSIDHDSPSSSR